MRRGHRNSKKETKAGDCAARVPAVGLYTAGGVVSDEEGENGMKGLKLLPVLR
jgi:hypothetical protein